MLKYEEPVNRWPAFSKPKDDELLSSWLVRLAMSHGLKIHTFCSITWPGKQIWNRDIDKSADSEILHVLAEKTGFPAEQVKNSTLSAYEGQLYEKHNPNGNTLWIMPVGVYHRTRNHFGLQFCPQCLAEDIEPHFRRRWRLAFITICQKHKVVLLDRCPACGVAVNFHRSEMGNRRKIVASSMTLCHSCGHDLRNYINDSFLQAADESEVKFQKMLEGAMRQGWVEVQKGKPVYSQLFFSGMRQIMLVLACGKQSALLRLVIGRECQVEEFTPTFDKNSRYIEMLPIDERRKLIKLSHYLLTDWPHRFIEICSGNRIWSSTLLRYMEAAPFWYWSVIHGYLYRVSYRPSDEEIRSAISYINKIGDIPFKKAVSRLLGVNDLFRKGNAEKSFVASSAPCLRNTLRRKEVKVVSIL